MHYEMEQDSNNIFFRCVEDSNEATMICDTKGLLLYVNPAWCRIYGYSKEDAIGKTPAILHSGLQSADFYTDVWQQILNPKIGHWKGELVNKAKDGTLVPVFLTITPFKSEKQSGFMGIALDITDKKELESKVVHQDRLASIGMLSSGLAHEIGTPLGVVRGRAEFMMMQSDNPSFKKSLGIITSEIDRISKLIRSLLRVGRSFSDVIIEDVSPFEVFNEILSLVGQNFKTENIELFNEIPEIFTVKGDFGRMEQVVLNLMMNSLHAIQKAKFEGRTDRHYVKIFLTPEGVSQATLHVQDTGCGISPENMEKLFKPFFTTKDVGEGTGLGLAIVAQLIREMEGSVSVQSTIKKGTTFSLTFKTN